MKVVHTNLNQREDNVLKCHVLISLYIYFFRINNILTKFVFCNNDVAITVKTDL